MNILKICEENYGFPVNDYIIYTSKTVVKGRMFFQRLDMDMGIHITM